MVLVRCLWLWPGIELKVIYNTVIQSFITLQCQKSHKVHHNLDPGEPPLKSHSLSFVYEVPSHPAQFAGKPVSQWAEILVMKLLKLRRLPDVP